MDVLSSINATHLLVVGGIGNLVLSFLLGWILSAYRMKGPMEPHRWLLTAHEVSLQEGLLLIGCAFSLQYAVLPESWAMLAAAALVIASVLQDFSGIVNWLRGTNDQFAQRSTGWVLATFNAIINTAGLGLLAYGVVRGL